MAWPRQRGSWLLAAVSALLLGACAVGGASRGAAPEAPASAAQAQAAAPAGGTAAWDRLVQAAKGEKLVLLTMTGSTYRSVVEAFQQQFPDVSVELTQARPSDVGPRLLAEQQNGQFLWDVWWGPTSTVDSVLTPADALEPMPPFLVLPEVLDDANWLGGLEIYSEDLSGKKYALAAGMGLPQKETFAVNYDYVSRGEVRNWGDLLAPQWKGKIAIYRPFNPITAAQNLGCMLPLYGEDWLRNFFRQQALVIADDARLMTQWVVTGRNPIAIGLSSSYLPEFQKNGLATNVDMFVGDSACSVEPYGGTIAVLKSPPHANATRLFVNWYLSQRGQQTYVDLFYDGGDTVLSRRKDVAHKAPEYQEALKLYQEKGFGLSAGNESGLQRIQVVNRIAREELR
ncbi:MAG TPA: hypothetical protein VII06_12840 [Chloroflexota bacterium]